MVEDFRVPSVTRPPIGTLGSSKCASTRAASGSLAGAASGTPRPWSAPPRRRRAVGAPRPARSGPRWGPAGLKWSEGQGPSKLLVDTVYERVYLGC
eukprot:1783127-Pyramimonas_sp.AAC.1